MSYEDLNKIVSLETVIKGNKIIEVSNPSWEEDVELDLDFNTSFIGQFANDLPTYKDGTAASGDQLPWGVNAVWQGIDFTDNDLDLPGGKFNGVGYLTDDTFDVGKGVSKYLLDSTATNAKINKFAIVIDSGVANLDDFNMNIVGSNDFNNNKLNYSFVDSDFDGQFKDENPFQDDNGHGTHVAGTIAAKANSKGVVGVAPGAEVISLKVFGASGSTTIDTIMSAVEQAVGYIKNDSYTNAEGVTFDTSALNANNTVINMSLGGGYYQPLINKIDAAANNDGIKFAIAAGNSNKDVDSVSPAASGQAANVYTISAVDKKYKMASFTNWDDDSNGSAFDDVDFAGPGVNVLSYINSSGQMDWWSGTSMATPAVAGLMLMTDYDSASKTIAGGADGIQAGENAFGNDSMPGPYVDPFALTDLKTYTDTNPDPKNPEEGDSNDKNDSSPWDGYDPTKLYYETAGLAAGVNGTYNLSTGSGSVQQSSLETVLSIESGILDQSMQSIDGTLTKEAIDATEGSGVKLTGYAKAGDTVSFSYIISSNDYIPYNDFTFVQLKTGDALGAQTKSTINTLGAIGLDIDDFGSKVGNYSYTFTEADFFSNDKTLGGTPQTDENGEAVYQGYFDLSVGVTDVIDTWVSTSLLVQSLQLTAKGDEPAQTSDTYEDGTLTWLTSNILGKGVSTGAGDSIKWDLNTGAGSVGQGVIETLLDLSQGELDTDLGGTKSAINATEGQFTYATTKAKVGEIVEFEAVFDTNDYSPYKDFSFYTINGEAFKIAAVGEDVADFGKIKKTIQYTVQNSDFDKDNNGVFDEIYSYDENSGGGNLKIGFGISDALDWCVDSSLEISKVKIYEPGTQEAPAADNKTKGDVASGFDAFSAYALGSVVGNAPGSISNGVINNDANLTFLELDTNYSYGQSGGGLATQSQIEFGTGLKNKTLDTSLNGTKSSKNATSGSAVYIEGVGAVGDQIKFDFDFTSQDYSPYQDFAFVGVNGEAYTLVDNGIGVDTLAPTGALAMVNGSQGSSNISGGTFTYTLTKDDLGGKFGDVTFSVGVMNALDNAVQTTLKMYNMQYVASGVTDDVGDFSTGFADDYVATYTTVGDTWVEKDAYSGFSLSTGGCVSNAASQAEIESLMGTNGTQLDQALQVYNELEGTFKTAIDATEGSAVKFNNVGSVGDIVSFFYNFTTNDYLPYADFSFFSTASTTQMIAGVGNSSVNNGNVNNYGSKEGLVTYTLQAEDIKSDGTFDITVGIVDAKDTWVESVIDIWGFNVTGSNETPPTFDENDENNNGDKPTKEEKENYDQIDIEMVGNTFQQNDAMVMSTGSGAVQQIQIESALGIKTGDLDTTLNNTKAAGNATEGSAAYDTVEVSIGDVISFGYTFGTDDYIPYQDFAFFSINGKVENIATVGVDVPNYGEISKVFNYVVTSADLGGETSGNALIGVGIVDAEDSWVDSFIEVYDFQISGEALENDKSNDGIVDGAGAFAIQTASASQAGAYSASNSSKVKLSIEGLGTISDDTSDEWTIAASTYNADGFGPLSAIEGGGYYTLFKALGTSQYAGKWAFSTTDLDGNITLYSDYTKGKAGIIDATWFDTETVVSAGWEEFFGYDMNNDTLISQLAGSTDALSLYSAQTGIIKIQDSSADVSTANILAATPTKADFSTFSKTAETYKILVAGTNANANNYQVWTSTNSGTIISKDGFVDYTGNSPIVNEWYTVDQAVSEGLEDLFTQDLNADGLISGGSNYQIFDAPNSKLQLKNIKGTTLSVSNTPEYNVIGAKKILSDNSFDVLFKGSSTSAFAGQYAIWKTNQYGKVTSEGTWFSEDYLQAQFIEEQFLVDANNDGFVGAKLTKSTDTTSGYTLSIGAGGQAIATNTTSKVSSYITYQSNAVGTVSGNYEMLDAESYGGTNYVLWNNTVEQKAAVWTVDSNWEFVSATEAAYGSADFYKLESFYGYDLDNNGVTAQVDSITEELDVNASKVTVESAGSVTASYGVDNVIYVAASNSLGQGNTLKFQNGQAMKNVDVGGTLVATENITAFAGIANAYNATDIAAAYLNDDGINIYVCDSDGTYITEGFAPNKTDTYFDIETGYNSDFDGDGIIGKGTAFQDNTGNVKVKYNEIGYTTIVEGEQEYVLQYQGIAMEYKFGNWTLQIAETNPDNSKVAFYQDSVTGEVAQWNCDANWNYASGFTYNAGDANVFLIETVYNTDLNSDSIIGLDQNSDGVFTDADLSAQYIENKGSISLLTDLNSQIYAGSASNPISFNGKVSKDNELAGLGWEIIGVDTGVDSAGTQNNYMVIKETLTGNMALCNFGSDWDYGAQDTFELFTNNSDAIFSFAEKTMVQDFNNNTIIGS